MRRLVVVAILLSSLLLAGCCGSTSRPAAVGSTGATQEPTADSQRAAAGARPTATSEQPTAEPQPTAPPAPTATRKPPAAGLSRSNPLPLGSEFRGEDWSAVITDVIRGDEAAQMIAAANMFNDPPGEGFQYLIANLKLTNISSKAEAQSADFAIDLRVTGDRNTLYSSASVVAPLELEGDLFPDGTAEGQEVFEVPTDEKNLQFVISEEMSFDAEATRFIAIHDQAKIEPDPALGSIKPTDAGTKRAYPAKMGDELVAGSWQFEVLEAVRGDEARTMVAEANRFNDPAPEGQEYVVVRVRARYLGSDDPDGWDSIDDAFFRITGERNVVYDLPSAVEPDPDLDATLFAGGETEGWVVVSADEGEGSLLLIFEPPWSFSDTDVRYIALDDQVSIVPNPALRAVKETDAGKKRTDPAAIGDTLVAGSWEFTVLESVRGAEAATMVAKANQFNDPAPEGQEYVVVRVRARYLGGDDPDASDRIGDGFFSITGERNVVYDLPSAVEPDPDLDATLFAGGEAEGWVVLSAGEGEEGLLLIFKPLWSFSNADVRYIALD